MSEPIKIQVKSIYGDVLFEYSKPDNTLRDTILEAVKQRANLSGANLSGADLSGADLSGANLSGADLSGANDADYAIAQTRILPEGDLIGYKKAWDIKTGNKVVVKLKIPFDARRSSAFGRKCRAEYAEVLEIIGENSTKARSDYNIRFTYEVGQIVKPEMPFDENWQEECASGIHFFITKLEAENY